MHWSFKDPSALEGSRDEKMAQLRIIRDSIKNRVLEFIEEMTEDKPQRGIGQI